MFSRNVFNKITFVRITLNRITLSIQHDDSIRVTINKQIDIQQNDKQKDDIQKNDEQKKMFDKMALSRAGSEWCQQAAQQKAKTISIWQIVIHPNVIQQNVTETFRVGITFEKLFFLSIP